MRPQPNRHLQWVLFGVAVFAVFWQLMLPPVKGVADNGDWGKLLGWHGLGTDVAYRSIQTKLAYADRYRWTPNFHSSEEVFIATAVRLDRLISRDGSMDIRVIGAAHAALYLTALWLFLGAVRNPWIGALAVALFCDFIYVGYLNSFYMDVAALIFTCLTVSLYIVTVRRGRTRDRVALFASMLLVTLSKPQYAVLGGWCVVLIWAARPLLAPKRKVAVAASVALLGCAYLCFTSFADRSYAKKGPFTVLYAEILPNSGNPDAVLAEFGLDSLYRQWIGQNAYSVGNLIDRPEFAVPFYRHVNNVTIGLYYARHPRAAWRALTHTLDQAAYFHTSGGNFDAASGIPPLTQYDGFQWSSKLKRWIFYGHGGRFFLVFLAIASSTAALLIALRQRLPRGSVAGGFVFLGSAFTVLLISALGDALDAFRHQLIFLSMFDMLIIGCVALLATAASHHRE
jgi:hypothetical protein